ncbi:hypothetical protein VITFI_CDS2339 [Vitreoscilla filiformis]|uniref:Porin domain-containing protein n=1 Tax=Vitreoscilla filiformis TaxID=63 RepID=A0A221KH01_VITFI|nr:porin [Vitreoscilla filiformis]ASM78117.1 hypothetical protein VITFI_CDS2339 [Vitreoscilla filiformis]
MKKALIPAALLLSLAGAAHAELALYGLIDLSYGKNGYVGDQKADFHSGGDDGSSQGNSTSRFGLKGSTDIGSGLKANFRLESNGIRHHQRWRHRLAVLRSPSLGWRVRWLR